MAMAMMYPEPEKGGRGKPSGYAERLAIPEVAMSALRPEADIWAGLQHVCFVPCVDGSGLARAFFTFCSVGRCSHVFNLLVRFT